MSRHECRPVATTKRPDSRPTARLLALVDADEAADVHPVAVRPPRRPRVSGACPQAREQGGGAAAREGGSRLPPGMRERILSHMWISVTMQPTCVTTVCTFDPSTCSDPCARGGGFGRGRARRGRGLPHETPGRTGTDWDGPGRRPPARAPSAGWPEPAAVPASWASCGTGSCRSGKRRSSESRPPCGPTLCCATPPALGGGTGSERRTVRPSAASALAST